MMQQQARTAWPLVLVGLVAAGCFAAAPTAAQGAAEGAAQGAAASQEQSAESSHSSFSSVGLSALAGTPAALGTGLVLGPSVHALTAGPWAWGAEIGYDSATEYTQSWSVVHDEVRLRLLAALQRPVGRGRFTAQFGIGTTVLHETRNRAQASRIGSTGVAVSAAAWGVLPAADLRVGVQLPVWRDWGIGILLGPAAHLRASELNWGWSASLSLGWLP